jgi:hypothetical protein
MRRRLVDEGGGLVLEVPMVESRRSLRSYPSLRMTCFSIVAGFDRLWCNSENIELKNVGSCRQEWNAALVAET